MRRRNSVATRKPGAKIFDLELLITLEQYSWVLLYFRSIFERNSFFCKVRFFEVEISCGKVNWVCLKELLWVSTAVTDFVRVLKNDVYQSFRCSGLERATNRYV